MAGSFPWMVSVPPIVAPRNHNNSHPSRETRSWGVTLFFKRPKEL